jgi:hypothetical protein
MLRQTTDAGLTPRIDQIDECRSRDRTKREED